MWNSKEMSQFWMLHWLGCLWTWTLTLNFKDTLYLGNGRPDFMERQGRESKGCLDVKHYGNESTGRWGIFDLDLWPWIFEVKLYLGFGRPGNHGTKGTGFDITPWCDSSSYIPLCIISHYACARLRSTVVWSSHNIHVFWVLYACGLFYFHVKYSWTCTDTFNASCGSNELFYLT